MTTLTEEQRLDRAHVALMRHTETIALSGVMMVGASKISEAFPTACTNGRDCFYGRQFVSTLSDPELRGLVLHENFHKMYQHLITWRELFLEDARCAGMAADYVINLEIADLDKRTQGFVKLPDGGLIDEKYRGMDTPQVYRLLRKGGGSGGGKSKGKGNGQPGQPNEGEGFDEHDWQAAQEMSEEDKQVLAKEIDQAIRQGAILAGKVGGNLSREFERALTPKVDWKQMLRDFIVSSMRGYDNSSWRRPNRRWVQHDIYLPSLMANTVGDIVIGTDTSGSIGGPILSQFLAETAAICTAVTPKRVHLLYWDARVAAHETYEPGGYDTLLNSTRPAGGGGTDPQCVVQYLQQHHINPDCIVMLTDGHVPSWGNGWTKPPLWCVVGNANALPTIGSVVHID